MKKLFIFVISFIIVLMFIPTCYCASSEADIPDAPEIEWDDDYSDSGSNQKIIMTAEVPDNAEEIKFYLFADDRLHTRIKSVSDDDDEVSQNFYSLDESQEVWGYVTAIDDDDDETDPSEWSCEYIGVVSDDEPDVDTPDAPEIEWEDAGESTSNNQRVTVTAELPDNADDLEYFLICDGDIKDSLKTDDEEYTFTRVDYEQTVIAYVKAYDGNDVSYRSETTSLYIGDNGKVDKPDKPNIQWIDKGYDNPNGQSVKMTSVLDDDVYKVRYFLVANGTVMTSNLTTSSTYTFNNVMDNQTVIGFVRAYDRFDNQSDDSDKVQVYIPNRTYHDSEGTQYYPDTSLPESNNRIYKVNYGLSLRNFDIPEIVIDSTFKFSDVNKNDKELNDALNYFCRTGIFDASFSDKFYPDNYISRIDFLKLMLKATVTDYDSMANIYVPFNDISYGDGNHNAVAYAVDMGLMNGDQNYRFHPYDPITYGQASKVLVKHFKIRRYIYGSEGLINNLQKHCFDTLNDSKILPEYKLLNKETKLTRKDAVKIIYRVINMKINS